MSILSKQYFHDEAAAYAKLESILWADGVVCPKCGVVGEAYELKGKRARIGLRRCKACKKDFTVKVGTVFESSHIELHKWFQAAYLMASSKKGVSAHQLHRTLEITYKSAWFMAHRLREAMRVLMPGALGGEGKIVEADETWVGGKSKNRARRIAVPPKEPVVSLVERGGRIRSTHVATVNAKTLRPILVSQIDRRSHLMTDESRIYPGIGHEFVRHSSVNHSANQYVRGDAHTNTVENYYSILKRGIVGTYHHVSPQHLKRYVGEFDFRYNYRSGLGFDDSDRSIAMLKGIVGKRLTYRDSLAA